MIYDARLIMCWRSDVHASLFGLGVTYSFCIGDPMNERRVYRKGIAPIEPHFRMLFTALLPAHTMASTNGVTGHSGQPTRQPDFRQTV